MVVVAETIFTAIGKKAGELAVNQIIKEGSRSSRVREDLEWIEIEMGRIQSYLQDAEAIQVKNAVVSNFIREIWNLAYDVEDIIDTYFPKLISSWSRWKGLLGFKHMIIGRAFSKEVEGIRKRVDDIREARKDFEADARSSSLEAVTTCPRQTFPHADEPNVVGINALVEELKQKVLDKDLHHPVVSITGTAGLGKTTLARKVYNSVRQHFDCAAWICVSERPNQQQLLRDIAEQAGLEENKRKQNFETNLFELLSTKSICKVRRVAIHGSDIGTYLSLHPQTSRVRTMLWFFPETRSEERIYQKKKKEGKMEGRVTKNLLQDYKSFRLLRIENGISSSVLTEICNLRQLTYLKLAKKWGVVELPYAISNLKSLLTLDLQESWEIYLPNVIWSMNQLRHILLPRWCQTPKYRWDSFGKFQQVEFSLTNLQTLSGLPGELFKADWLYKVNSLRTLGVYNPIETESKDIIEVLSDGTPVSHKLEHLYLRSNTFELPQLKSNSLNLSRYENLSRLDLFHIKMIELPQHDKLPPNLTILTLNGTHIEKDPMETLKKLQKLKILKLLRNSYEGKDLVCSGEHGDFPELEVLEIEYLPNIEMVVVEEGGMPRLRDFKIITFRPYEAFSRIRIPDRLRNIIVNEKVR